MNKQIKKLYDEAWAETTDHYATIEKFAKLIILDCIKCVERTNRHDACTTHEWQLVESTIRKSALEIKQRFEL